MAVKIPSDEVCSGYLKEGDYGIGAASKITSRVFDRHTDVAFVSFLILFGTRHFLDLDADPWATLIFGLFRQNFE